MLKCAHCDKRFKYESERKRHQESHFPQFSCTVCAKKFSFMSALRRHQKQHERKGTVWCNDCGGSFRDNTLLKRHMLYAHKGSYSCLECSATFSSEQALHTHSYIHKPESERRFRCKFAGCKKTFNFPHHLKHHELSHTNAKQYFCNFCEKGFIQSHHLKTHLKTHLPENWLPCMVPGCKIKCTTKHALKNHMTKHSKHIDVHYTGIKLDSGISSDSNPANDMLEKNDTEDNVKCITCEQLISRLRYLQHARSCTVAPRELTTRNDLEGALLNNREYGTQDSSSRTYQVTSGTYAEIAKEELNKICNNIATQLKVNYAANCDDTVRSACASCTCSDARPSSSRALDKTKNTRNISEMPELEYRKDGIIKIKETFDADIIIVTKVPVEQKFKDKTERTGLRFVPYNSCKEVLGNCIVSDDGSVGEGCLCAKMLDDEQVSAQEIEELTPNPQALWV